MFVYLTCPRVRLTRRRLTELRRIVRHLPTPTLREIANEQDCAASAVVTNLRRAVDKIRQFDQRPDVGRIVLGGVTHWLTGGIQRESVPTPAYADFIWLRAYDRLANRLAIWALADCATRLFSSTC